MKGKAGGAAVAGKILLGVVAAGALAAVAVRLADRTPEADRRPVDSISHEFSGNHLHGVTYDSRSEQVLLATHYGLFSLEDGQLYQLADSRDDYMGFTLHPHDPAVVYTSGHAAVGGNLGVQRSTDGGLTFAQIFRGVAGEVVDFHSMAISPVNPQVLYGAAEGLLYRTRDDGESWVAFRPESLPFQGFCWGVPCLAADTGRESRLYAGASDGLFVSENHGDDWSRVPASLGSVAGVAVSPHDSRRILVYSSAYGLAVSNDGGGSWTARNDGLMLARNEYVFDIVFDPQDPKQIFVATTAPGNQVYRSTDGGETWDKMLPQ